MLLPAATEMASLVLLGDEFVVAAAEARFHPVQDQKVKEPMGLPRGEEDVQGSGP